MFGHIRTIIALLVMRLIRGYEAACAATDGGGMKGTYLPLEITII